jgi:hypothetical protein
VIQFYDAENIGLFPSGVKYAALYADGDYAVKSDSRALAIPNRRWITVLGDPKCGIADFEPDNEIYASRGALRAWAADRIGERRGTPVVYVERALTAQALGELDGLRTLLWIPTGDGKEWTAEELAADLAQNWHVTVPASMIWGNQNIWTDDYDRSDLFGDWWA